MELNHEVISEIQELRHTVNALNALLIGLERTYPKDVAIGYGLELIRLQKEQSELFDKLTVEKQGFQYAS